MISMLGVAFSVIALLVAGVDLALKLAGFPFPIGNPTIVIVVSFFSGIQMLSLGVIGEYVGRIYDEARQRPKFIIESSHGIGVQERVGGGSTE
jgi:dolichol-phosphate mannosyltransferase